MQGILAFIQQAKGSWRRALGVSNLGVLTLGALGMSACSSGDQRALENIIRERAVNPAKVEISEAIIYRDKNDARRACLTITDYNQWGEPMPVTRVNAWFIFKSQSWFFDNFLQIRDGLSCEEYAQSHSKDGAEQQSPVFPLRPIDNTPAPPVANKGTAIRSADNRSDDDVESGAEGTYYAEQADIVARQAIVITDDDTQYACCLKLADIMRYFSAKGASYQIYPDDNGGASLEVSDPAGRWNGWTSMTLEFVRKYPADAPLVLSQVKVGNKEVASINDTSGVRSTNGYLKSAFRLTFSHSYE